MTKELFYDLHFTDTAITSMTDQGDAFLMSTPQGMSTQLAYRLAIDQGLHVRFENAAVRDSVTGA
jgi:hypothetical protein